MAAVLACGERAWLSHGSAAALWGIERELPGRIEICVPRGGGGQSDSDLVVRRRRSVPSTDLTTHVGIPLSSPARTLLDLATRLSRKRLEAAVNAADKHDLISPPALRAYVESRGGQPGVPALRRLLDHDTFALTDSELERLFIPIATRAGLPKPATGAVVNGFKVDFYWPELGLIVETDGLRYHRTPSQQARDRLRDQAHAAAGMTTLRFTHSQVRFGGRHVEETLCRVAAIRSARPRH